MTRNQFMDRWGRSAEMEADLEDLIAWEVRVVVLRAEEETDEMRIKRRHWSMTSRFRRFLGRLFGWRST